MNKTFAVAFIAASTLLLAGCPAGLGGKEGTKTPIGAGAGAVVGGVAGSTVGSGKGRVLGTALGAVLGGLGGAAAEEGLTRQKGVEITVRLDSGRMLAITQAVDEEFRVGDRVRVLSSGGTTRVSH
jgi:outer membrane lipoprotein SlyB